MLGDLARRRQMGINLIANALEASAEKGGLVTLAQAAMFFSRLGTPGPGMPAETLGRIFDPFFTPRSIGRGLGLAAVSGIVSSHGGAISVATKPSEGSSLR